MKHKQLPNSQMAEHLLAEKSFPLISIYMPTHIAGPDIWQDPIRLKNLIRAGEKDLKDAGMDVDRIAELMRPFMELQEDRDFWQHQRGGLALFRSDNLFKVFQLREAVPELCVVGSSFHVKPLLMSIADERTYYVLSLSQSGVRLFRGSSLGLEEMEGLDWPEGPYSRDYANGKPMQVYSAGHGGTIQHGFELNLKGKLAEYCKRVDQVVQSAVNAEDLVILAAVDYLAAIYTEVSSLHTLAEMTIAGSPDFMPVDRLFNRAEPIAAGHFDKRRREAQRRFLNRVHTGKVLDRTAETLAAAREGRVETLFVPMGVQVWGHRSEDGEITLSDGHRPQDEDLLNLALIDTWKAGGEVFVVAPDQMPGGRAIAAVARY